MAVLQQIYVQIPQVIGDGTSTSFEIDLRSTPLLGPYSQISTGGGNVYLQLSPLPMNYNVDSVASIAFDAVSATATVKSGHVLNVTPSSTLANGTSYGAQIYLKVTLS